MADDFGLEIYDKNEEIIIDSNSSTLKMVARVRVTSNTSFSVIVSPPYEFVIIGRSPGNLPYGSRGVSPVSCTSSGHTVSVTYSPYQFSGRIISYNMPVDVVVLK